MERDWSYSDAEAKKSFPFMVTIRRFSHDDAPILWCVDRIGHDAWVWRDTNGGTGYEAEWMYFHNADRETRLFFFKSDDVAFEFKLNFG